MTHSGDTEQIYPPVQKCYYKKLNIFEVLIIIIIIGDETWSQAN